VSGFVAVGASNPDEINRIARLLSSPDGVDGALNCAHIAKTAGLFHTDDLPAVHYPDREGACVAVGDIACSSIDASLRQQRQMGLYNACRSYVENQSGFPSLADEYHFVLWDAKRFRLLAGRDPLGVRPLYYWRSPDGLVISSAVRLLVRVGAPREPEVPSVRRFVAGRALGQGRTYWTEVRRLGAGEALVVKDDQISHLPNSDPIAPPMVLRADEPVARFRETFIAAIEKRLAPASELVSMLSGGLDSSAITVIAANALFEAKRNPLKTFSLTFDATPQWSERSYIEAVGDAARLEPHIFNVETFAPFSGFSHRLEEHGGLFFAPGLYLGRSLYEEASTASLPVMLDGHGGDEVVSYGLGRLHSLAMEYAWKKLFDELKGLSHWSGQSAQRAWLLYFLKYGPMRKLVSLSVRLQRGARRRLFRNEFAPPEYPLLAEPHRAALAADLDLDLAPQTSTLTDFEAQAHFATVSDSAQALGLETLDAAASAAGVSVRYPFWDRSLIDVCLALPSAEKLDDGFARMILRRAVSELPDEVRWRRGKLDFSPHLAHALGTQHQAFLRRVIEENGVPALWEFVDLDQARSYWSELQHRREQTAGAAVHALWRVCALACWLHQLDGLSIDELVEG
jgi:asparagine synthase (glutamine-hydrolysing)